MAERFTTGVWAVIARDRRNGSEWIWDVYHHKVAAERERNKLREERGGDYAVVIRPAKLTLKLDRKVRRVG